MKNVQTKKDDKISRWISAIMVLFILGIISFMLSIIIGLFISGEDVAAGNVAVIPISGVIKPRDVSVGFTQLGTSSDEVIRWISQAESNPNVEAVVFEINSPGGYPVASNEIVKAIKKMNKTKVSVIRDIGASGAYWIASATDKIFCDELSMTGSIGVNSAFISFSGLMSNYNVSYERIVGGKYKDLGSPLKEMTDEEREILQDITDSAHEYFIKDVAKNRNIPLTKMDELAQGQIFLGIDAYTKGLVDEIGGMDEAFSMIGTEKNISVNHFRYKRPAGLLQLISSAMNENSFFIGKGIGEEISNPDIKGEYKIIT